MFKKVCLLSVWVMLLGSCTGLNDDASSNSQYANSQYTKSQYSADITRTEGGIPHIVADDWGSLGFGTAYAMAEDNVCFMAEHYQMMAAERSRYHGPKEGRLESDFFYQLLIDRALAREPLNNKLEQLFLGAANGFNHYLNAIGIDALPDASCRGAGWVKPVRAIDVKRISRIDIFLDYLKPQIVAAAPPEATVGAAKPVNSRMTALQIASRVEAYLEVPKQGGSNGIAVGSAASENGAGLLLANPHVAWHEKFFRFFPMHQTIPGELDIIGANMIGRPRVGFGATRNIAWTNTVSKAKRMSFYRLKLVPGKPDHYLFDGKEYAMKQEQVTVRMRNAQGELESRSHTFYSTHFDAMLVESDFFSWNEQHAFAVKTLDLGWRPELAAFAQYDAKTVRELKQVHDDFQFMTVNLIAVDRDGEALYAEPGPVPLLTEAQLATCTLLHGAALDGSRSECQWGSDASAVTSGIYGPGSMPHIYRSDYVTNSNDSYWLSNPNAPLNAGYTSMVGSSKTKRTLRTRSGLAMMQRLLQADSSGSEGKINLQELIDITLANENYAGQLIRDDLVAFCRETQTVEINGNSVDLNQACDVLAEWDLHSNNNSRGAHLFRETLAALHDYKFKRYLPESLDAKVAFDINRPIDTPSGIAASSRLAALAGLGKAVLRLQNAGVAIDAPLGDVQYVMRNNKKIPIHGGQEIEGVFNKIESDFVEQQGYPEVTRWSTSWLLAADFKQDWPQVKGLLAYSISLNPESPYYSDQTELYSNKQWLDIPFKPADIRAAAKRRYSVQSSQR